MKKINLRGLKEVLSEKELKHVLGGSAGCSMFYCKCNGIGDWTGCYSTAQEIIEALNRYCNGRGTCNAM